MLALPAEFWQPLFNGGVRRISAVTTRVTVLAKGMEPASVSLKGLAFEAPIENERAPTVRFPGEGTFALGPYTVTGKAGEGANLELQERHELDERFAPGEGWEGLEWHLEGFNEHGEKIIGPLVVECTVFSQELASIPITVPRETAEYASWTFSGSLTPSRLAQPIQLPTGSTFNGSGEVNPESGAGSVTGRFSVPPFTTSLRLFGVLPLTLGMTLAEEGPANGTIAKSESVPGEESLALPAKLKLGITSVGLLGLSIPTKCATAVSLSLGLADTLTLQELLTKGWAFAGGTAVPQIRCEGGFLGNAFGGVLSALLSGPEARYALKVSAPG